MRVATAFEAYLRTGRRFAGAVELKFNPWHDPDDGRFTFAGRGRFFPGGSARRSAAFAAGGGGSTPNVGGASGTQVHFAPSDPHNPANHGVYVVRKGDSLGRIAATRRGLTVADLEWFNGISAARPLRVGQRLKIPHQRYLDEGKRAYDEYRALQYYAGNHGGQLPPNPADPPSVERQILDSNWRRQSSNGYDALIDVLSRPRKIFGELSSAERPRRSRRLQVQAGGRDRRPTDDGGHYIAGRFNGPLESFNHFAQDANFNRGAYRLLEGQWADNKRAGRKVFIEIVPHYPGRSLRPDQIVITWSVGGHKRKATFSNESGGKADGRR